MPPIDVPAIRHQFPALSVTQDGRPVVYLDGPGGTQVPGRVIDAMTHYYRTMNANHGGRFLTSERSDAMLARAHEAVADLFNADAREVKFGANMTTLNFALSRSIGATLGPGDEVVVTRLDHEANVGPWHALAGERDVVVRTVEIREEDCTLDIGSLEAALSSRTKHVAVGLASNAVGTINPVREIVDRAHAIGASVSVDAVHFAPHGPIDVRELDCDYLLASAYKFFGPHVGILYGKRDALDRLPAYKVRPAEDRWETGTQDHEGIAGTLAAVEYLAEIGERFGAPFADALSRYSGRRLALKAGLAAIRATEMELFGRLSDGLEAVPGMRIWGIRDRARWAERCPTVAFRLGPTPPAHTAAALGRRGIFAWDGDYYATGLMERLGIAESGGAVRVGLVHYNTPEEVDRLIEALHELAR
ncbi:MAG: cysteine desulfurase-like protein [Chloroflexota bacterium]